MILARVMKHVKEQNWFAVALDFLIVVIGVFFGMQVNNWNADRQARALAEGYIARLRDDVELERAVWARAIDYFSTARGYAETAIAGFSAPAETLDEEWLIALYQASQVWYVSPNRSTFDELQSTGRIVNLEDEALRTALANHYKRVAQTEFTLVQNSQYRRIARLHLHETVQAEIRRKCGDKWVTDERNFYYVALPPACEIDLPGELVREEVLRLHDVEEVRDELRFHLSVLAAQIGVMRNASETAATTLALLGGASS